MARKHSNYYDIAIVGGGISGIYTAWRLILADKADRQLLKKWKKDPEGPLKIAVFEGSHRIGGKLLSVQPPDFKGDNLCEIGGMRVMWPNHYVMASLVDHLKFKCYLQVVESKPSSIPSKTPTTVPLNWNIAYLRGEMLRLIDEGFPESLPYKLTAAEQAAVTAGTSQNLISWAIETLLPDIVPILATQDPVEMEKKLVKFLQTTKYKGKNMYQWGFWNFISDVLSNEGRELGIKTVGYDCLGGNSNAYNSIMENMDFTTTATYNMLFDGYDAVPWTLQQQFEKEGGEVLTGHWLESFEDTVLENGKTGVALTFNKQKEIVNAGAIICAMPRRSLELLAQKGPVLDPLRNPRFQFLMNSITPVPLFKMCLIYETPWWEQAGVTQGRSMTDLPLRQVYYLPSKGPNGEGMVMVYNDMESSVYWSGYETGPLGPNEAVTWDDSVIHGNKNVPPHHIMGHAGAKKYKGKSGKAPKAESEFERLRKINWANNPAPHDMVEEMHTQLMLMHGVSNIPPPVDAAFADWNDDPYGGAVHFWNSGYKSWEVMKEMIKPVKDFPCFIVGEAWSETQTWAEGAVETAELLLTGQFKLSTPKWLTNPPPPPFRK